MKGKTILGRKKNYVPHSDIGLDSGEFGIDISGFKPNKVHDYSTSFIDKYVTTSLLGTGWNIIKEILFGSGEKLSDGNDVIKYKGKNVYLAGGEELKRLYNEHNEDGETINKELAGVYVKKLGRTYINRKLFDDPRLHHLIEPTIKHEDGHKIAYHVLPEYGIQLDKKCHEDFADAYEVDPVKALRKLGLEVS